MLRSSIHTIQKSIQHTKQKVFSVPEERNKKENTSLSESMDRFCSRNQQSVVSKISKKHKKEKEKRKEAGF